MDGAGDILGMNAAAERMFGYPRHEAMGQGFASLLLPEDVRDALMPCGDGQRLETHALRRGGERFPSERALSEIDTPGGMLFTAWVRDLTERRTAEEGRPLSQLQLRQAQKM